jgi:hypothetical protein
MGGGLGGGLGLDVAVVGGGQWIRIWAWAVGFASGRWSRAGHGGGFLLGRWRRVPASAVGWAVTGGHSFQLEVFVFSFEV